MDLKQVVKLLELMESHGLDEVEIEQGETRIRLRKRSSPEAGIPMIAAPMPMVPLNHIAAPSGGAPAEGAQNAAAPADDTEEFLSPMVGTFYRSAAPDADPFVSEGDTIGPDTVVCLIEAMKVMNEIKAEIAGEIAKILVENGESVEYGQPLMIVRKPSPTK